MCFACPQTSLGGTSTSTLCHSPPALGLSAADLTQGETPSGLGLVEGPTQPHYLAFLSVGLLTHFPHSGLAPWPPSAPPGSRPREPRGPAIWGRGQGGLAVSCGDAGTTHWDTAAQGAILLELRFSPSFLGECCVGCGWASFQGMTCQEGGSPTPRHP